MAHPEIRTNGDTENLYEYLTFQFVMGEGTMFKNIFTMQPGHYMTIELDTWQTKVVKYWEPNFNLDQYHTEEYFIVELRKILDETISQQLRSDVPIGTYLSGGIDSSLVTVMASKFLDKPIKSFSEELLEKERNLTNFNMHALHQTPQNLNSLKFFQLNRSLLT